MSFAAAIQQIQSEGLKAAGIKTIQVNLGFACNMACAHCHVDAGPGRKEQMGGESVDHLLKVLEENPAVILDVTGGAPELNPYFRYLVSRAKGFGCPVIVRTNLTVFFEDGMEGLPEFYKDNGVALIASLPYYLQEDVNRVRGPGVFEKSIEALGMLNRLGYGHGSTGLVLNIMYNPQGVDMPPEQTTLEAAYKKVLFEKHGIVFDNLYALTNMPLGRFRNFLERSGNLGLYMALLKDSLNKDTLAGLMCRHGINVGWDGRLYDCDFNQISNLAVHRDCPQYIGDFDLSALSQRKIMTGEHCYGCTAARGST